MSDAESEAQAVIVLSVSFGIVIGLGAGWCFWAAPLSSDAEWLRFVGLAGIVMIGLASLGAVLRLALGEKGLR